MRLTDDLVRDLLDDLGLSLEPNEVAAEIAPVAHALSTRAPRRSIEQKAAHAADAVWSDDLRSELAVQLAGLRGDAVARLAMIDAAVEELDKPAARNRVALALVYESAATVLSRANRNYELTAALEERLEGTPVDEHRALTLPLAATGIPAARIEGEEADEATARFIESFPAEWAELPEAADQAAHWLARSLATDERREAMRSALRALADSAPEEFPRVSAALTDLLEEPTPEDPADDDLWVNLCVGLVQEELALFGEDDDLYEG
ncbi:MAG: hypothetical protein ACRDOG_17800 [Gaiellaceae bacterium]